MFAKMSRVLITSVIFLIALYDNQTLGQETRYRVIPPRGEKERALNQCTHNFQIHFEAPLSLKYNLTSSKTLPHQTSAISAPLLELLLIKDESKCLNDTFGVTIYITDVDLPLKEREKLFIFFTMDGYVTNEAELGYSRSAEDSVSWNFYKLRCYLSVNNSDNIWDTPKCCSLRAIDSSYGEHIQGSFEHNNQSVWTPEIYFVNVDSEIQDAQVYPEVVVKDQNMEWNCSGGNQYDGVMDLVRNFSLPEELVCPDHMSVYYQLCNGGYAGQSKPAIYQAKNASIHLKWCFLEKGDKLRPAIHSLNAGGNLLIFTIYIPCAVLYLIVLVIYGSIWDKIYINKWAVVGFMVSQFLSNIFLIGVSSTFASGGFSNYSSSRSRRVCELFGILRYFFSLSPYSWTLILGIDNWITFSSLRHVSNGPIVKGLMVYSGFAIGVPALVVFTAKMVEMFPPTQNAVIPGYLKNCAIPPGTPYMVWIGAVNILLFSGSLVFALLTFRSLWRAHHHAQILTKSKSQSILLRNKILTNLLPLMGLSLITECILNFGELTMHLKNYKMEAYKLLQAVGLFLIFLEDNTQEKFRIKFPELYKTIFPWRKQETL